MSVAAGPGVRTDYLHISKLIRPAPVLTLDDTVLKWYDIAPLVAPVPREMHDRARSDLREAWSSGALELSGELGFVILHRCGQSFYFLLVSTAFRPWPSDGTHRPTFCVWELGAVCHEQRAWSEYLRSRRDESAREAYLQAVHEGVV
ncbi:MAG: hypothetical protein ACRDNY_00660 [Gaiellaceae bacterium]